MSSRTSIALFAIVASLTVPAHAQQNYVIQPGATQPGGESKMELRVAKTGLYSGKVHVFVFPTYTGTLRYDAARPEASEVKLTLPASAIKLTDEWLNEKDFKEVQRYALEEMLDAKKYPEITFTSTAIMPVDATHYKVTGMLAIRGVPKPAVVDVELAMDGGALRFDGSAVVKLTDYGLKPPKALLGLIGTKNEMDFGFALTARPE